MTTRRPLASVARVTSFVCAHAGAVRVEARRKSASCRNMDLSACSRCASGLRAGSRLRLAAARADFYHTCPSPGLAAGPPPARRRAPGQDRFLPAVHLQPAERLVLDGRLTEEAWRRAASASGFIQQDPNTRDAGTEATEGRV